jgi:drug/metabolite transporter (DMT)-like permease
MLRFGVASILLLPAAWQRGVGTDRIGIFGLAAMVLSFGAPYVLLISFALKTAPAAAAGALNPGFMAIISVLLGWLFLRDRIGGVRLSGLAVTALGIILFTATSGAFTTGHMVIIGTSIMWASYALIVRCTGVPALNATAIVAVGSAVFFAPIYFIALPKQVLTAPMLDIIIQAGFQGILVSIVAIFAFNRSAELLGPLAGATLPALIPIVTLCLGVLILGEMPSNGELFAAIIITIGLVLILVGKQLVQWILNHTLRREIEKPQASKSESSN